MTAGGFFAAAACLVITSPNVCHLYFFAMANMVAFNSEETVAILLSVIVVSCCWEEKKKGKWTTTTRRHDREKIILSNGQPVPPLTVIPLHTRSHDGRWYEEQDFITNVLNFITLVTFALTLFTPSLFNSILNCS